MAHINENTGLNPIEVLAGPFDPKVHAQVFVNYLEVVIDDAGEVLYATPSHLQRLISLCIERYANPGITCADDVWATIPEGADPVATLCRRMDCICVWSDRYEGNPNASQADALLDLSERGLYTGPVPVVADLVWGVTDEVLGTEVEVTCDHVDVACVLDTYDLDELEALEDDTNRIVADLDAAHLLTRRRSLWPGTVDCYLGATFAAYLEMRRRTPDTTAEREDARRALIALTSARLYDERRRIEDELHRLSAELSGASR